MLQLQVNAASVVEAQAVDVDVEPPAPAHPAVHYEDAAYYLTWPAGQSRVCCVTGQWDYTSDGEIEAWYSVEQLKAALASIEDAIRFEKKGERELEQNCYLTNSTSRGTI